MGVYRFCGADLKEDPRRTKEYVDKVMKEVKLEERDDLLPADKAVIKEVITRKASAFWVEDTPRTTL